MVSPGLFKKATRRADALLMVCKVRQEVVLGQVIEKSLVGVCVSGRLVAATRWGELFMH